VNGVSDGDVIALIDPEIAARRSTTSSAAPMPPASGPSR
jgi:hypothetical protein